MRLRSARVLTAAALLGALLTPLLPAAPAQADSRSPSTFTGVSANDYSPGSCSGNCSTPSVQMRCDNPDGEGPQVAATSNSRYYKVWANPTKRTTQTQSDSFTLSASFDTWSSSGTYTIPMQSADSLVSHDDGWQFKSWTKRRGIFPETGPDAINEGNFTTTGSLYNGTLTVQVAQTVGVAGAAALGAVFCEHYHYEKQPDVQCPYKYDKKGNITNLGEMCKVPDKRVHDSWEKVSEWKSSGVVFTNVHETQSWAGSGAGLCLREYHGELTGPYQVDWSKNATAATGFLDNIQFAGGREHTLASSWDDTTYTNQNVHSIDLGVSPNWKFPNQALSAYTGSDGKQWVKSLYGMAPGMNDRGWRNCIGLHIMTGDWQTPVYALGRYTGRITWRSDWVSIVDVPNTRPDYRQKWDWLNDQVSANSPNRWVTKDGDKEAQALGWPAGSKWGGYILMQVGRDHPTLQHPAGEAGASGVNIVSRDEGLYYQKSCLNADVPGFAADDDAYTGRVYGTAGYKRAPLDYIAPNMNAPLNRDAAYWTDGANPAMYYQNTCGTPGVGTDKPNESVNPPSFPNLGLVCSRSSKAPPTIRTFSDANLYAGQQSVLQAPTTENSAQVRANGSSAVTDFGQAFIDTSGGTTDNSTIKWQARVDVPSQVGLNSPSLVPSITTNVNDRRQPYNPSDKWTSPYLLSNGAMPPWWDLNTWHDTATVPNDTTTTQVQYWSAPAINTEALLDAYASRWFCSASATPVAGKVWVNRIAAIVAKTGSSGGIADAYWKSVSGLACAPSGTGTAYYIPTPPGNDWVLDGSAGTWSRTVTSTRYAAEFQNLNMKFFENAVAGRAFQLTASWLRTSTVNTTSAAASSWGALTGSTMDGDIGWSSDPGYSVAGPLGTRDVKLQMKCVSNPATLQAQRVANVAPSLQR